VVEKDFVVQSAFEHLTAVVIVFKLEVEYVKGIHSWLVFLNMELGEVWVLQSLIDCCSLVWIEEKQALQEVNGLGV
jgi:hypothetical protein